MNNVNLNTHGQQQLENSDQPTHWKCFNLRYFTFKILVYLDFLLESTSILGTYGVPNIFFGMQNVSIKQKQQQQKHFFFFFYFSLFLLMNTYCMQQKKIVTPMSPKYLYF